MLAVLGVALLFVLFVSIILACYADNGFSLLSAAVFCIFLSFSVTLTNLLYRAAGTRTSVFSGRTLRISFGFGSKIRLGRSFDVSQFKAVFMDSFTPLNYPHSQCGRKIVAVLQNGRTKCLYSWTPDQNNMENVSRIMMERLKNLLPPCIVTDPAAAKRKIERIRKNRP